MLYKHTLRTRQSPMQKAIGFGENVTKFVGGAKAAYDTARTIYGFGQAAAGFAQSAAPYVSTAAAMLV